MPKVLKLGNGGLVIQTQAQCSQRASSFDQGKGEGSLGILARLQAQHPLHPSWNDTAGVQFQLHGILAETSGPVTSPASLSSVCDGGEGDETNLTGSLTSNGVMGIGIGTQQVSSGVCWVTMVTALGQLPGQHGGCVCHNSCESLHSPSQLGGWKNGSASPWALLTVSLVLPGKMKAFSPPGM